MNHNVCSTVCRWIGVTHWLRGAFAFNMNQVFQLRMSAQNVLTNRLCSLERKLSQIFF